MKAVYPPRLSSRAEAISRWQDIYFNGVPCPKGHLDYRRITGACLSCASAKSKANRAQNPEKHRAVCRAYHARNRERLNEYNREYRAENPEKTRAASSRWKKNNRARASAIQMARHAKKKSSTCECCTKGQFVAIYEAARLINGHVDHVVPLALGGPHCTKNLQVLTVEQHIAKTAVDKKKIAELKRAA